MASLVSVILLCAAAALGWIPPRTRLSWYSLAFTGLALFAVAMLAAS